MGLLIDLTLQYQLISFEIGYFGEKSQHSKDHAPKCRIASLGYGSSQRYVLGMSSMVPTNPIDGSHGFRSPIS